MMYIIKKYQERLEREIGGGGGEGKISRNQKKAIKNGRGGKRTNKKEIHTSERITKK